MASSWRSLMRKGVRRKAGLSGWKIGPGMRLEGQHAAGRVELARQARASPITS